MANAFEVTETLNKCQRWSLIVITLQRQGKLLTFLFHSSCLIMINHVFQHPILQHRHTAYERFQVSIRVLLMVQIVELQIQRFSTEPVWDHVKLYDGFDDESSLITPPLSGALSTSMQNMFLTTQRYLFIQFTSDSSITNGGFNATYTSK